MAMALNIISIHVLLIETQLVSYHNQHNVT